MKTRPSQFDQEGLGAVLSVDVINLSAVGTKEEPPSRELSDLVSVCTLRLTHDCPEAMKLCPVFGALPEPCPGGVDEPAEGVEAERHIKAFAVEQPVERACLGLR